MPINIPVIVSKDGVEKEFESMVQAENFIFGKQADGRGGNVRHLLNTNKRLGANRPILGYYVKENPAFVRERITKKQLLDVLIDLVSEIEAMPGGEYFDLTKYRQAIKKAK